VFAQEVRVLRSVWIERASCTGCNVCVEMCPEVFELDEEAVAMAHPERADGEAELEDCMDACPEGCIHWRD
jgi:ferredoxin